MRVSALLLLYDVTNKTSYDNIRAWLGEIREYAQDDVVIMLIGGFQSLFPENNQFIDFKSSIEGYIRRFLIMKLFLTSFPSFR